MTGDEPQPLKPLTSPPRSSLVATLVVALSGLTTPLKLFTARAQYFASTTTSNRPTKPSKPNGQGLDTNVDTI